MKALLVQQEVHSAIDVKDFPKKASDGDNKKIKTKTYASTLLNLNDKVLREVCKELPFKM